MQPNEEEKSLRDGVTKGVGGGLPKVWLFLGEWVGICYLEESSLDNPKITPTLIPSLIPGFPGAWYPFLIPASHWRLYMAFSKFVPINWSLFFFFLYKLWTLFLDLFPILFPILFPMLFWICSRKSPFLYLFPILFPTLFSILFPMLFSIGSRNSPFLYLLPILFPILFPSGWRESPFLYLVPNSVPKWLTRKFVPVSCSQSCSPFCSQLVQETARSRLCSQWCSQWKLFLL